MCKTLRLLVVLLCTCLWIPAQAETLPVRVIQDGEHMLLDGRDISTYDSGELHSLFRKLRGPYADSEIGYNGYYGEEDSPTSMGLHFPFEGFQVYASTESSEILADRDKLLTLPLSQTTFPITYVMIDQSGIPGPFGVEVGMPLAQLQSMFPEGTLYPAASEGGYASYVFRYADPPSFFHLSAFLAPDDTTSYVYITRDLD